MFSAGEAKISQILTELQLEYKKEYIFKDYPNARFDFALLKNNQVYCLIEYDGPQHFINTANSGGWNTIERYKTITHPKDLEKNKYCQDNNIPLIRIPYNDYNNLTKEWLERKINNV